MVCLFFLFFSSVAVLITVLMLINVVNCSFD